MDHLQNTTVPEQSGPQPEKSRSDQGHTRQQRGLWTVALVSVVCGALGGVVGSTYAFRSPAMQKLFSGAQGETVNQRVVLAEDSAVIDVVNKAAPAVVSIVISKDLSTLPGRGFNDPFAQFFGFRQAPQQPAQPNIQQVGAGSGFFVTADGLILTNKHVVSDEQASYTVITNDGSSYDAKVLARDSVNDLAIIKVDIKNAPTVPLADPGSIQIGQRVVAIGNSLGQYQNTVTSGIVSGIGRSITASAQDGREQLEGVIQTDAAINPGNSGGPLLNSAGQVIGINTAIDREGQLVGFAIPVGDASRALESFQKNGRIVRPLLGVRYAMITPAIAKQENLPRDYGALVVRGPAATDVAVLPGSSADRAGLQENDIILEINGKKVEGDTTLSGMLKEFTVGDTVSMKVYHKGEEKTVQVTLQENKQ